jgi:GAF domain-containing protein
MGKRSKARGEPKARHRKKLEPKRRAAPKAKARSPAIANETEIARLSRELKDARDQHTAMSEVLHAISRSKFDLRAVLGSVAEAAARLCRADGAVIFQRDGDDYRFAAGYSLVPAYMEIERQSIIAPGRGTVIGRAAISRQVIRIDDLLADPLYELKEESKVEGYRSMIGVPLLRDSEPMVVIGMGRRRIDPFGEREIELATTFAAQAMIAIENARLLSELHQRTGDLTEALEQQTATSEVLQVISTSPGDLEPVFQSILEKAARICEAEFAALYRREADGLRLAATYDVPPAFAEAEGTVFQPAPGGALDEAMKTGRTTHIADLALTRSYIERHPRAVEAVELAGIRTSLCVPMVKDDELIGIIGVFRQRVRPFGDKQIELVTDFAAQAVIAFENARLLNELRQRTTDLTEALEQQTATSDVLRIISASPSELQPVFQAILEKATRLCEAKFGALWLREGDVFRIGAGQSSANVAIYQPDMTFALHENPNVPIARMIETKAVLHVADLRTDQSYIERSPRIVPLVEIVGARTFLGVPMLQDNELVGAFVIYRTEVRRFTDKQIALVQTFAAQAVVAIENARLLNELRQRTDDLETSLEYQTATSDVLKVISGSVFDLRKILKFVAETAARLCAANQVGIFLLENDIYRFVIGFGLTAAYREIEERLALRPGRETLVGRVALEGEAVHILDALNDPHYGPKDDIRMADIRSVLGVPLTREGKVVGVIALARKAVSSFSSEQIDLVRTFADQAVIAIENARLVRELRERTEEVEKLNQQLEARVADQVGEIERMGRLRRFLPPQVADLIVASGSEKQLESHRREITALFCDLRGFTGFTESADAEDVMALLRDYHAAIGEIIIKYSGTLERYAGDGVMVVFNDPVPVANPALQAVLMALDMRAAIGALTGKWRRMGHDIGFGIGIAHGFATLGTIGFEGRFDYAAIGTVANVASRLCDEAKPGQILISPRVLMEVEDAVAVEPVGEFALKGIRRPLAAYNVLAARSGQESGADAG